VERKETTKKRKEKKRKETIGILQKLSSRNPIIINHIPCQEIPFFAKQPATPY
jgi:hypothetical protein